MRGRGLNKPVTAIKYDRGKDWLGEVPQQIGEKED